MDEAGSQTAPGAGAKASRNWREFVGPPYLDDAGISDSPVTAAPSEHAPPSPGTPPAQPRALTQEATTTEPALPLPAPRSGTMSIDPATAIAVAVVVGGLVLVAWMRGRGRGTTAGVAAQAPARGARATADAPTADSADVEQTAIALAALVREADARIAELKQLKRELDGAGPRESGSTAPAFRQAADAPHTRGVHTSLGMPGTTSATRPAAFNSARPTPAAACADPVAGRVYELADSGLSPVQIASMLHEHTGKVELILALRRAAAE